MEDEKMTKLTDAEIKDRIGGFLKKFTEVCVENNYEINSPEFTEAWAQYFGLPILVLCEGDMGRAERLKNEYGREHNIPIHN